MATVLEVKAKEGTTYAVDENGARDIRQKYQVILSEPLASGELLTSFSAGGVRVPAIGSAHPARPEYYAERYEISQPSGAAKATLDITVVYVPSAYSTETIEGDEDEDPIEVVSQVVEWGWDSSTSDRELVTDAAGVAVLNSAGDVFESVPSVQTPAPVFTKVIKMPQRVAGYSALNCKVNTGQLQIGDMTCPPFTLLCTISERRNIGDPVYPYTYTVNLKYRSNRVKRGGDTQMSEIGWHVAIADAGMREIDDTTGKLKVIQSVSQETGELVSISSPELLDGHGHAIARSASGSAAEPYNLVFAAYESADFPNWLYSEP